MITLNATLCSSPCNYAPFYEDIQDNLSIDATLLAVLLKAGLPLPPLDTLRLHAVWQSGGPDALQMLLDHGLKLHESQDAQSFLPTVFDQPGLLARLLEAGGDPNLQDAFYGMSPVAWAVLNGKVAALDILLAKGGRLETAIPEGTASSLLELAVYSKNPAMLARLGWSQADLSPLCFDSDWGGAGLVLDSEETYWEQLLQHGFGRASAAACPPAPIAARVLTSLLGDKGGYLAGWGSERLNRRLAQLAALSPIAPQQAHELLQSAQQAGRQDVTLALQGLGFHLPESMADANAVPPVTALQRMLMASWVGDYYLQGFTKSGVQLRLYSDGHFFSPLTGDAVDLQSVWQWRPQGDAIVLRSGGVAESIDWLPYRRLPLDGTSKPPAVGKLRVRLYYQGQLVDGGSISVFGCQAPQWQVGTLREGQWEAEFEGKPCQFVLQHSMAQRGKPFVYDVPAEEQTAMQRDWLFEIIPGKQDSFLPLNATLQRKGKVFIWTLQGVKQVFIRR